MKTRQNKPDIKLNTFEKMEAYVKKYTFPYNLSEEKYEKMEQEYNSAKENVGEDDAYLDCQLKYSASLQIALSDFIPIDMQDNDKRKRTKKISMRIVARENQTKCVTISPGLHDLFDNPSHISFYAKDNVLAIGKSLPNAKGYKLHVEHNGYMIKSESLVDYLCEYFKLNFEDNKTNEFKPYKNVFANYSDVTLKDNGGLTTVVFMYLS
jgi:hypothetical protein